MSKVKKVKNAESFRKELVVWGSVVLLLSVISLIGIYRLGVKLRSPADVFIYGPSRVPAPFEMYIVPCVLLFLSVLFIIFLAKKIKCDWIIGIILGVMVLVDAVLTEGVEKLLQFDPSIWFIISLLLGIGMVVKSISYHKICEAEK